VGRDVIFRRGDPTVAHDLVRVGAHNATSILVMLNERDAHERKESQNQTENSATLRCVLAIRNVIYSNGEVTCVGAAASPLLTSALFSSCACAL
jgi:hypothetical protein